MSESNHATDSITSTASNGQCVQVVSEMSCEDPMLEFSEDEEDLIARMFRLVGKRWSLIAGRIPGRTAEEIEKYWTSKFASPSDECSSCA